MGTTTTSRPRRGLWNFFRSAPTPAEKPGETFEEHGAVLRHDELVARPRDPIADESTGIETSGVTEQTVVEPPATPDYVEEVQALERAQRSGNGALILEKALSFMDRFPASSFGFAVASLQLLAEGRDLEAEEIASRGVARCPEGIDVLVAGIEIAFARGDLSMVGARIDRLSKNFADHPFVAAHLGSLEERHARGVSAERVREVARSARAKEGDADWVGASRDWDELARITDGSRDALVGLARCLREAGEFEKAEDAAREASARYPEDIEAAASLPLIAARRGDHAEAATRWQVFLTRFPDCRIFDSLAATSLAHGGKQAEAEALLDQALSETPDRAELRIARAVVAQIGDKWGEAASHWAEAIRLRPGERTLVDLRGQAIWHRDLTEEGDPAAASQPAEPTTLADMMLMFEGVGDNCEFGLVQRNFGAEPVGLLRFAAIEPDKLLELLESGFEPLGDPAHTRIEEANGEYVVLDDRGYYWMHSFVHVGQIEARKYLRQQEARIVLLKRKLLAQLREGGRIYVCKQSKSVIPDRTVLAIHAGVSAYGRNDVLAIRPATDEHPPGSVDMLEDGVFVGYLSELFLPGGATIDYESWSNIVPAVLARRGGMIRAAA